MTPFLVEYSGSSTRLFFRVFFTLVSALITFTGKKCLSTRAKLKLAQGRSVKLTLLSPWLSDFDSLSSITKTHTLPGGWLGIVMVAAFLLDRASDLTSALVQSVPVHDRCEFGTGLVVGDTGSISLVPWNGAPYTVASQAQVVSLQNGGEQGIYRKANRNINFAADYEDVLGYWNCTRNDLAYNYAWNVPTQAIQSDLYQYGLLYGTPVSVSALSGNASTTHLVILDTSAGNQTHTVFDVRIAVDTSAFANDTKNMQCYQCVLHDTYDTLRSIQMAINSLETLSDWRQIFQGAIYDGSGTPASNNTGGILEQVLNSMTMVAGGQNYLLDTSHSTSTQGCLTNRTRILWELVLLTFLTAMTLALLVLYWIGMALWLKWLARSGDATTMLMIDEYTPSGPLGWMAHGVREFKRPLMASVEPADLSNWYFGKWAHGSGYGIVGRDEPANSNYADEAVSMGSANSFKKPGGYVRAVESPYDE
ncbi:hypothetical protein EDD37DRAFT_32741 [Exophiala viscosa]|uniref:uncharacterized protein n=1 Tax=Exophiala viscosa TaxID=2486360 RepID=UPI0021962CC4|nr:hypothetical protein EDD37DRAFT_32741 [Exophiala viscosa]